MTPLALGIDLGTSGVRIALINGEDLLLHTAATAYTHNLCHPQDWVQATKVLIESIAADLRLRIQSVAVDGTSGTLLACTQQGDPLGQALAYSEACPEHMEQLQDLATDGGPAASSSGSLARALRLIQQHGDTVLLRHQADWSQAGCCRTGVGERKGTTCGWDGICKTSAGPRECWEQAGTTHYRRCAPVEIFSEP